MEPYSAIQKRLQDLQQAVLDSSQDRHIAPPRDTHFVHPSARQHLPTRQHPADVPTTSPSPSPSPHGGANVTTLVEVDGDVKLVSNCFGRVVEHEVSLSPQHIRRGSIGNGNGSGHGGGSGGHGGGIDTNPPTRAKYSPPPPPAAYPPNSPKEDEVLEARALNQNTALWKRMGQLTERVALLESGRGEMGERGRERGQDTQLSEVLSRLAVLEAQSASKEALCAGCKGVANQLSSSYSPSTAVTASPAPLGMSPLGGVSSRESLSPGGSDGEALLREVRALALDVRDAAGVKSDGCLQDAKTRLAQVQQLVQSAQLLPSEVRSHSYDAAMGLVAEVKLMLA